MKRVHVLIATAGISNRIGEPPSPLVALIPICCCPAVKAIVEISVEADSMKSAIEAVSKDLNQTELFNKKVQLLDLNYDVFGAEKSNGWNIMND